MARILFISSYYPPEKAAAAVCISEAATRLLKWGHEVTVLTTFPNYPTGVVFPQYQGRRFQQETLDGVRVIRSWSYTSPNKGFLRRILAYLSFACTAPFLAGKAIGRPDLIIIQSPPLFDAIAGRILAWWKRCPFIFIASDLWPESAVELGILRNRALIRLSEWLEWSTYRKASLVWVVTERVRDLLVQRGLAREKVFLQTYGVDTEQFHSLSREQARATLDWDDRYTVLYAGNHGLVYSLFTVLDAAEQLQHYADIRFVFVGDGAQKADLVAEAARRQLTNVTFFDAVAHNQMPVLQAAADVCLIPLQRIPLLETSIPVKMFEIMASARPLIIGAEGITRKMAEEEARAALYAEPENADALSAAILSLRAQPELAAELAQRGRAYVEAHFDYNHLIATLHERISTLLNKDTEPSVVTPSASAPLKVPVERS